MRSSSPRRRAPASWCRCGFGALEDPVDLRVAAERTIARTASRCPGAIMITISSTRMPVEDRQRVLQDRVAGDLDQLLREVEPHPDPDPAGQEYGGVPCFAHGGGFLRGARRRPVPWQSPTGDRWHDDPVTPPATHPVVPPVLLTGSPPRSTARRGPAARGGRRRRGRRAAARGRSGRTGCGAVRPGASRCGRRARGRAARGARRGRGDDRAAQRTARRAVRPARSGREEVARTAGQYQVSLRHTLAVLRVGYDDGARGRDRRTPPARGRPAALTSDRTRPAARRCRRPSTRTVSALAEQGVHYAAIRRASR